ncbi:response regulator transcription factor [Dyadobacter sp. 3J3]|uniref:response regulator n=1 Tax=Dyadobacter sp. 3J3 TaxID=2606600 RepID=UPI00135B7108|nr:response regulator transcription factor [Dyadobacter sp. 3J3]
MIFGAEILNIVLTSKTYKEISITMEHQDRILIIEDHELILWGLTAIIEDKFPEHGVHSTPTFDHGFRFLEKNVVSMIVLDIDVPGGNTPEMITTLRSVQPEVRILVHTALSEESASMDYLTAGADGFLSKNAPFATIEQAIGTVLLGGKYMSQQTQSIIAQNYLRNLNKNTNIPCKVKVTPREAEIIGLILNGKWTKEIADELGIKWSTVSTHKLRIFEKFEVTNEIQLYQKIEKDMPELIKHKKNNPDSKK